MAKLIRVLLFVPEEVSARERMDYLSTLANRLRLSIEGCDIRYTTKTTLVDALDWLHDHQDVELICLELIPVRTDEAFSLFDRLSSEQQARCLIKGDRLGWFGSSLADSVQDHPVWRRPNLFDFVMPDALRIVLDKMLEAGVQ